MWPAEPCAQRTSFRAKCRERRKLPPAFRQGETSTIRWPAKYHRRSSEAKLVEQRVRTSMSRPRELVVDLESTDGACRSEGQAGLQRWLQKAEARVILLGYKRPDLEKRTRTGARLRWSATSYRNFLLMGAGCVCRRKEALNLKWQGCQCQVCNQGKPSRWLAPSTSPTPRGQDWSLQDGDMIGRDFLEHTSMVSSSAVTCERSGMACYPGKAEGHVNWEPMATRVLYACRTRGVATEGFFEP